MKKEQTDQKSKEQTIKDPKNVDNIDFQKEIQKKDAQIKDLTETAKMVQANFENFKKRIEKEQKEFQQFANAKLILRVLDIIDTFELALKNDQSNDDFRKGIELIYAQLQNVLEEYDVTQMNSLGEKFDPYKHEAMIAVKENEKENGIVLEEFQKGYSIGDRVIRHSKVKINKL